MKKVFFLMILFSYALNGQIRVDTLISQKSRSGCWAAMFEMNLKFNGIKNVTQCDLVKIYKPTFHCENTNTLSNDSIIIVSKELIKGYSNLLFEKPPLRLIKKVISENRKPMIYVFPLANSIGQHTSLITDIEQQIGDNKSINFLKVNDPWPVGKGNKYYITNEKFFMFIPENNNETNPKKYLIYDSTQNNTKKIGKSISDIQYSALIGENFETLPNLFLEFLKKYNSNLSKDFFEITNLPSNNLENLKIGNIYNVIYNQMSTSVDSNNNVSLMLLETSKEIPQHSRKVCTIMSSDTSICTIFTVSQVDSLWYIDHIESGSELQKEYRKLLKTAENKKQLKYILNKEAKHKENILVENIYGNFSFLISKRKGLLKKQFKSSN